MNLVSKVTKAIPYTLLGVLVEQDFFAKQFNRFGKWYNPHVATVVNGSVEAIVGLGYASIGGNPFIGTAMALDGSIRSFGVVMSADPTEDNWREDPIYKKFDKKGSLFLEIPWYIGKTIYNTVKNSKNNYDVRCINNEA